MSILTPIANKIAPSGSGLIVHGIVAVWIVSWLTLIADGLYLDRYVSRTCYEVGVYNMGSCVQLSF